MKNPQSLATSLLSLQYELALLVGKDLKLFPMLRQFFMPALKMLGCQSAHVWLRQNDQPHPQWVFSYPTANSQQWADNLELNTLVDTWHQRHPSQAVLDLDLPNGRYAHVIPIGDLGFVIFIRFTAPIDPSVLQALSPIVSRLHLSCKACLEHEQLIAQRLISVQNEQRIEAVLQSIDDIVFQLDPQGRITYVNPAWKSITGYPIQEALGHTLAHCLQLEEPCHTNVSHFIAEPSSATMQFQTQINTAQGNLVYLVVQIRHTPHLLASNTLYIGSINNITEQSELINHLRDARKKSEAAAQAKSTFLSTMSHEMRTPLNGILGLTEACISTTSEPETKQQLSHILDSGQHLLSLINDVLDYSRIDAGFLKLQKAPFDLHALLDSLTQQYIPFAMLKGLTLSLRIEANTPQWVNGDIQRLKQVLIHLLSNAIKFTDRGRIHIRVQDAEATKLLFEVSDTGIGVAPELSEQIFEAFTRAHENTARHFGGAGLGLAITQKIVHSMRGRVGVRPQQPKGSCFWFTADLPAVDPPDTAPQPPPPSPPQQRLASLQLPRYRVLVVDDHPINRKLMGVFLEQLGQAVTFAENGEQAIQAHQSHSFDMILMDIQMPVMDGLEATQRIRADELDRGQDPTPIYAISANSSPQDVAQSKGAGMNGHLAKPVSREVIAQTLHTLKRG